MNPNAMDGATPNEDTLRISAKSRQGEEKVLRAVPLHPEDLTVPITFQLKDVHRNNPALASLYTDNGQRLNQSTVTVATGAFLSGLVASELARWPLWVFCSPAFSNRDVEDLATVEDLTIFKDRIGDAYLAWQVGECSVCVDEFSVAESLEEAFDTDGKLLVAFISDEALSIRAIDIDENLLSGLQATAMCNGIDSTFTIDDANMDWDDDVNFGDFRPADWMEGPQGEDAYRMKVRHLSDYAVFVPTRAAGFVTQNDLLAEAPRVRATLYRVGYERIDSPVMIEARGRHLGDLVPETCADFPALIVALPEFMGEDPDLRALAKSPLMPCSVFETDTSFGEVELHLNSRQHQLRFAVNQLSATIQLADDYRELILAFVGIDNVSLRHYALDDEWFSLLGATAYCADNKTGKDLWTSAEFEAGGTEPPTMLSPQTELSSWKALVVKLAALEP